ncbi:MAG: MBL fold metallo-hydrolase [Myxococcota bacterium]
MSDAGLGEGAIRLHLRTPTLPPATATNTLILGGSRLCVIEPATPFPRERSVLDDRIAQLAADGRRVEAVLLTHHHVDHVGYAEALAQRLGVPIHAHEKTAERVDFDVDVSWEDGAKLDLGEGYLIEAVFTPGHAPGHLVFHERKTGLAYAGDMVAAEGTILIDPEDDGDMAAYLRSLAKLKALGARALVPSHGQVLEDPVAVVDHYVAHRLKREGKVLAALGDGPMTDEDLLARVYDDTPKALWPLAARSLEAHLRKLESETRVARDAVMTTRLDG